MTRQYQAYRVRMRTPAGNWVDLSLRLLELGSATEALEGEELLQLTHDDLDMTFNDVDGSIASLFTPITPGARYEVVVEADTGNRRMRWQRLFAGYMDLPWSVRFYPLRKEVEFTVFSYSKLLEDASAESIARTFTGVTASISAGSISMTLSTTSGLLAGDEITLTDASNEESYRIEAVTGGTTATVSAPSDNAFSGATVELDTPYQRNQSIEWLVEQLFDAAGVEAYEIRREQVSTQTPFASLAPSTAADLWEPYRPYSHAYTLEEREVAPNSWELWVKDGGVDAKRIDNFTDTLGLGYSGADFNLVYDPDLDKVWVSFRRTQAATEFIKTWEVGTVPVNTVVTGAGAWAFMYPLRHDTMGEMVTIPRSGATNELRRFNRDTEAALSTVTLPGVASGVALFDNERRVSASYRFAGKTVVRVWLFPDWTIEGSYTVFYDQAVSTGAAAYDTGTEIALFGQGGGEYYIVSRQLGGLVPYADFSGLSCGAALVELAKIAACYVRVDRYRVGHFVARSLRTAYRGQTTQTLPTPLELEVLPLTELWRNSVTVSGRDAATDEDFEVISGVTGDSAHRLDVSSPLINDVGLARAVGEALYAVLSTIRGESTAEFPMQRDVEPLLFRRLEGVEWLVLSVETDYKTETQRLRLLEGDL